MTPFLSNTPSNSSQQFFSRQHALTDFTTKLASTVELTDEWEVGLAEIMFPSKLVLRFQKTDLSSTSITELVPVSRLSRTSLTSQNYIA